MANEIIVLDGSPDGNSQSVLFYFPIAVPKQVNGSNVVPTPTSGLTSLESSLLSAAQKTALDAGTALYRRAAVPVLDADTPGTLTAKAQALYSATAARETTAYNSVYKYTGSKLNAP